MWFQIISSAEFKTIKVKDQKLLLQHQMVHIVIKIILYSATCQECFPKCKSMWTEDICKNIFKKNIEAIASNYYSITGKTNNENDTHEFEHFLVKRWFTSTEEIIQKNEESTDEDTTINTDDEIMRSVHLCIDILNNATGISNPLKHKKKKSMEFRFNKRYGTYIFCKHHLEV